MTQENIRPILTHRFYGDETRFESLNDLKAYIEELNEFRAIPYDFEEILYGGNYEYYVQLWSKKERKELLDQIEKENDKMKTYRIIDINEYEEEVVATNQTIDDLIDFIEFTFDYDEEYKVSEKTFKEVNERLEGIGYAAEIEEKGGA